MSDEGGTSQPWKVSARLGIPFFSGLDFVGSYQTLDEDARYLPAESYRHGFDYHRLFLKSGNLELRGCLGVRGRDPTLVPRDPEPADTPPVAPSRVPFHQLWIADL